MEQITVQAEHIGKKFRSFEVKDVSFTLESGYILGLTGRNGAGKTTLMKLLLNPEYDKKGKLFICGIDARKEPRRVQQEIGVLMEEQMFFYYRTLLQNGEILGAFYDRFDMGKFKQYLSRFDLNEKMTYGELSRGMRMKFQLAFALAHKPKLLLMDEATGGLDVVFRREFFYLIQEAVEQEMLSVIISTHVTEDLDKVADYVAFIEKGQMKFYESKEELYENYRSYRKTVNGEAAAQGRIKLEDVIYHYDAMMKQKNIETAGKGAGLL